MTDYFANNLWHLRDQAKHLRNDADALLGRAAMLESVADNLERYGYRTVVGKTGGAAPSPNYMMDGPGWQPSQDNVAEPTRCTGCGIALTPENISTITETACEQCAPGTLPQPDVDKEAV